MSSKPVQLELFRTGLAMRGFQHASADRDRSEAIVFRLEYDDGVVGWGETLPRRYVTGETLESVVEDVRERIWPACLEKGLLETNAKPEEIPRQAGRRCMNAAAAGVDLAGIRRIFHDVHAVSPKHLQDIAGRPRLRTYIDTPVSGVLGNRDPSNNSRKLRLMRWFGLRNFKLKLGFGPAVDRQNLEVVHGQLRRGLEKGDCTLRVDVNGGWTVEETPRRVSELMKYGVCCVEQPVYVKADELLDLAERCELPLMADESLLGKTHAKTLLARPEKIWWNLRISKNGGLLPTLSLMRQAEDHGVTVCLGCMVGESSILSAAQRRLLQMGPVPRFVEGNYGRFLLKEDLRPRGRSLRFGYGGHLKTLSDHGLGVSIDEEKLRLYSQPLCTLNA